MIKPEFFDSESLGKCSIEARMLFVGLWVMGDDFGNQKAQLSKLKMQIFPYDDIDADHFLDLLCELEAVGCIKGYEVDGQGYINIPNFACYQTVRKPSKSAIPEPSEKVVRTRTSRVMHQWRNSDALVKSHDGSTTLVQHQYVTSDAKERKKEGSNRSLTTSIANEYCDRVAVADMTAPQSQKSCPVCDCPMDAVVSESGAVTYSCDLCGYGEVAHG